MRQIAWVIAAGAILAAAAPAFAAPAAPAPHWVEVGTGPGGGTAEVDRGSLNFAACSMPGGGSPIPRPSPTAPSPSGIWS